MTSLTARHYLVVVDHTLGGTALAMAVKNRSSEGAEIRVLAPSDGGEASVGQATERLQAELGQLDGARIQATGAVTTTTPLDAVTDAVADDKYDGIIIATQPHSLSKLVHMDLARRLQRKFEMPVEWIESRTDDPAEQTTINVRMPRNSMRNL